MYNLYAGGHDGGTNEVFRPELYSEFYMPADSDAGYDDAACGWLIGTGYESDVDYRIITPEYLYPHELTLPPPEDDQPADPVTDTPPEQALIQPHTDTEPPAADIAGPPIDLPPPPSSGPIGEAGEPEEPFGDDVPQDVIDAVRTELDHLTSVAPFVDATRNDYRPYDRAIKYIRTRAEGAETTTARRYIHETFGDPDGDRVRIDCSRETIIDSKGSRIENFLLVTFETGVSNDGSTAGDQPYVARTFFNGEVLSHGGMTNEQQTRIAVGLMKQLPLETVQWIDRATRIAGTIQARDKDLLHQAVADLLTKAHRAGLETHNTTTQTKRVKAGDMTVAVTRLTANSDYRRRHLDIIDQEVRIELSDGVQYTHLKFIGGSEQMVIETDDPRQRAALRAQGFAVLPPEEVRYIDPHARREGVLRPSRILMRRVTGLLGNVIDQ